jgi:hypothetical protein
MADLKFPMPEGFTLPEGGDTGAFEVLATLEVEGDQLRLVAIDGIPVGGSEMEPEEEAEYAEATDPDTGDFQKAMTMGMGR